jgi:hypothetical protein
MQLSLFYDYQGILDSSSFHRKYDALFRAFDLAYGGREHPELGRKGYPNSAYLKALIFKQSEQIKHVSDLRRKLDSYPVICMMCGFEPGKLPDASQFSRFLSGTRVSEIEETLHRSAKLLIENGHASADVVIGDSKPVKAYTKHNNPKNPNRSLDKTKKIRRNPAASLGYYSYIKQPSADFHKHFSFFWGYRTHVLISREGIVLVEITKPNNVADKTIVKALLRKLKRVYGQRKGRKIILDAAYDFNDIYNFIAAEMKAKPYIALNPRYKNPVENFDPMGRPICEARLSMKFSGTTREEKRVRMKYRCPIKTASKKERQELPGECPISHSLFSTGKCYGCTAYVDTNGEERSSVQRLSKNFKDTFKLRTGVERYFSRLGPREFEDTTLCDYRSVRNQMTIAHLTLNLVAVAATIVLGQPAKIRCHKTFADDLAA